MPSCAEHIRQADKNHKARFQFRIRLRFGSSFVTVICISISKTRSLSSLIISKFSGAIKPPRFFMASQSFSANFSQKLYIILTIFSIPTLWISIVFQKKLCYNQGCSSSSAQRFAGVPQRGSAPAFGYHKGGKGRLPRPHESMLSSWNRYRFHYC